MNQKFSIGMFFGGLPVFLGVAGEMLAGHNEWKYFYETPLGFCHALALCLAFVTLVVGALGIQIPRGETSHADRKTDVVATKDDQPV